MHKRRALILTDISTLDALSGEPDDTQSLLRLLLYSDQIDILGLIATYTEHLNCAAPHLLREALGWYRAAYQNLRGAVPFMAPEALEEVIFQGSDAPGVEQIKAAPSPGAARIARCALSAEEPLYVLCWGGVTDLAQALSLLEAEQPPAVFSRCLSRLRVYAIADQYDACGPHIRRAYPQLFYITAYDSFRGMYRGGPRETCAPAWLRTHIAQGPYGRHYPIYDGGDAFSGVLGPVRGLKEGDSPSFLYLVQNGLSDPERPEQGGWGGRFLKQPGACHYFDAFDCDAGEAGPWACVSRWREDFQRDFAARMALANGRRNALHYPWLSLRVPPQAAPGARHSLFSEASPGAAVAWRWYPEAGDYQGNVLLTQAPEGGASVYFPSRRHTGKACLIARAQGPDGLCRYARAVITVGE